MAQNKLLRHTVKATVGGAVSSLAPQCRFDRSLFLLAHMRCGSTALSNVLCSHPDISGYGEAKVSYVNRASLGILLVNQVRRKTWTPTAAALFDKILHTWQDKAAPDAFFTARGIFLARRPAPTIRSIQSLYQMLGKTEYRDQADIARYYISRIDRLIEMWHRFPPERRIGLTFTQLLGDPEMALSLICDKFKIDPPLENRYESLEVSRKKGAGDPIASGAFSRIEARVDDPASDALIELDLTPDLRAEAEAAYARYTAAINAA